MQPFLAKLRLNDDPPIIDESVIVLDVVAAPTAYGHQGMALVVTEHFTIEYVTLDRLRWRFIGPDWPMTGFNPNPADEPR